MKIVYTRKILLILGFLLFLTAGISVSQDENKLSSHLLEQMAEKGDSSLFTAWVFFNDKGPELKEKMLAVKGSLEPRAVLRRLRHHRYDESQLIDRYDVPVHARYVQEIQARVDRIRHASRWLNAVSVEATGRTLREVSAFDFVQKVDTVKSYIFREPGTSDVPLSTQTARISQIAGEHVLDYGGSFGQVEQINVPVLHDQGFIGDGILICMLDGGFDNLEHQALDHIDIVDTWDFVNDDPIVWTQDDQMEKATMAPIPWGRSPDTIPEG